jgi:hypothetical protein
MPDYRREQSRTATGFLSAFGGTFGVFAALFVIFCLLPTGFVIFILGFGGCVVSNKTEQIKKQNDELEREINRVEEIRRQEQAKQKQQVIPNEPVDPNLNLNQRDIQPVPPKPNASGPSRPKQEPVVYELPGQKLIPDIDPKDPRPAAVRRFEYAKAKVAVLKEPFSEVSPNLTAKLEAYKLWKLQMQTELDTIEETKNKLLEGLKKSLREQSEKLFPVPSGTKSIDRAKIEGKQNAWIDQELPKAKAKIIADYTVNRD